MPVFEVKVIPVGTTSPSFSSYVTAAYKVVEDSGLKHQLTPTSTIIEGDYPEVMQLVQRIHESPFNRGARRVMTTVSIDERRDRRSDMRDMVQTVKDELAAELTFPTYTG